MANTKNIKKAVAAMAEKANQLESQGYVLLNKPRVMYDGIPNTLEAAQQTALQSMGCDCGDKGTAIGGASIDPGLMVYLGKKDARKAVPEKGADGKPLGTPGLGYIKYGKSDRWPLHVYRLTQSQPYTSTALRFNTDLVTGKGVELMYVTSEYVNGKVVEIVMPYELAGTWLEGKIAELKGQTHPDTSCEGGDTESIGIANVPGARGSEQAASGGYLASKGITPHTDAMEYRVAAPAPTPSPSSTVDHSMLGTTDYQLKRLYEDYDAWVDTMDGLAQFQEQTKLDKIYKECMADDQRLDIFALVATLEQGRRGSWDPKVCKLEYRPMTCVRMEEMDDNMRINYVYYSDKFMYDCKERMELLEKDLVAFPLLRTDAMEQELKTYVANNQKTAPGSRQLHFAVLGQEPCGFSNYYPQPAWWSIFSSLVFQYVSTLMYDKAVARQNATMWGKLIYINNNYLQQYFADCGANTVEEKQAKRDELIDAIEGFLRERKNNGKTCTLDSFIAPGTNTVIKSIEIVDVPQPSSSNSKEDMEELANLIFWAYGIHTSMIASFGKGLQSGGTQQRELFLLKQIMMSSRQRRFTDIINGFFRFNRWDKHLECRIGREVLSTLDASKTGIVEEK